MKRADSRRPKNLRPDYVFSGDRQHWIYLNAHDAGWPIKGSVRVKLEKDDPQMIGPEQWWAAESVPDLYIRAAFHTKLTRAELFWSVAGQSGFSGERSISFEVNPDGQFHTYRVHFAGAPNYTGVITGLRLDPVPAGGEGEYVDIAWISWRQH